VVVVVVVIVVVETVAVVVLYWYLRIAFLLMFHWITIYTICATCTVW
jgi:hypothetical protein